MRYRPDPARRHIGTSLVEYVLIGLLIVAVSITAVSISGDNLNEWLASLQQDAQKQIQNTQDEHAAFAIAKAEFEAAQARAKQGNLALVETDALNASGSELCGSSWCVSAPGLTGTTVSTAGSNGNQMITLTNSAANIYSQMAKILAEQGADSSIINLLTNMANQGHALGNAQSAFTSDGSFDTMKNGMQDYQSGLANFQQMDQKLRSMLSQLPADTRGILQDASNVIIGVGDSYTFDVGSSNIGWRYQSSNISLTHANSNTICQNGGNTSICVQ